MMPEIYIPYQKVVYFKFILFSILKFKYILFSILKFKYIWVYFL